MGCLRNKKYIYSKNSAYVARRKRKNQQITEDSLLQFHDGALAESTASSGPVEVSDNLAAKLNEVPALPDQVNAVNVNADENLARKLTNTAIDHCHSSPTESKKKKLQAVSSTIDHILVDHTYSLKKNDQDERQLNSNNIDRTFSYSTQSPIQYEDEELCTDYETDSQDSDSDNAESEYEDCYQNGDDTSFNSNNIDRTFSYSTQSPMQYEDEKLFTDYETDSQDSDFDNAESDYEDCYQNGDDTSFIKNSSSVIIEDCHEDEPSQPNSLNNNNHSVNDKGKNGDDKEKEKKNDDFGHNDIVNVNYFMNQMKIKFKHHKINRGSMECESGMNNLHIIGTTFMGMRNHIWFRCATCGQEGKIWTTPYKSAYGLEVHEAAVVGTLTSGIGYQTLKEVLNTLKINVMTERIYIKHRKKLADIIKSLSELEMKKAAEEEYRLAVEAGDVTPCGLAKITVIADMQWSKRSYRSGGYNALSGTAVIIGARTGKVIHCAIYNKACATCAKAARTGTSPRPHPCDRNWDGTSTAMEPDGILKGFRTSVMDYGLIYETLICDGDSSIMDKINTAKPYEDPWNIKVNKIECKNHLFRNLSKKLTIVSESPMPYHPPKTVCLIGELRQQIKETGLWMRIVIEEKMIKRMEENVPHEEKIENLKKDIESLPNHFFGNHEDCVPDNEDCKPYKKNYRDEVLERNGLMKPIIDAVKFIAKHADSLLENQTNNPAEGYNSVLNKLIGGKRINFSMGNSYTLRAHCAVIQYNTQEVISKIIEKCGKRVPDIIRKLEETRQHERAKVRHHRRENGITRRPFEGPDENYGRCVADMDNEKFDREMVKYKFNLQGNIRRRVEIEKETRGQSDCLMWREIRKKIITASTMYDVIRAMESESIERLQKEVTSLYKRIPINTVHTRRGIEKEGEAIVRLKALLEKNLQKDVNIEPCGIVIDLQYPYLGASPDGLIDDDGIIELKCLSASYEKYPTDTECQLTITEKYSHYKSFYSKDLLAMNQNHKHYFQVQALLHITNRQYCYFTVYTKFGMYFIKVIKDEEFWTDRMEKPLIEFFEEWFLPELVDSRVERRRKPRIPERYIQISQQSPTAIDDNKKKNRNDKKAIKIDIKKKMAKIKDKKRSVVASLDMIPSKIKKNNSQQNTIMCCKYFGNSIRFMSDNGSQSILYYHLCPYNSFLHGLMTLYEKELDVQRYIEISDHPYLKTLTNIMNTSNKNNREIQWIMYLRNAFSIRFNPDNKLSKDMSGDAAEIMATLLKGLNSGVLQYNCPNGCNDIKRVKQTIIFARFTSHDLSCIPHVLDESMGLNHKRCGICKEKNDRIITYGDLVLINTAISSGVKRLKLDDIPQRLNISTNSYTLKFVIHYRSPIAPATIGHYTCYCLIDSTYICIDDTKAEKAVYVDSSKEVNPCLIVYWKEK